MHYLILDTNIYLDMLLGRDHNLIASGRGHEGVRTQHTFDYLDEVLSQPGVHLVVPEVVEREVETKAEDQINQYAMDLNTMIKQSQSLPLSMLGDEHVERVKSLVEHLHQWKTIVKDPATRSLVLTQFRYLTDSDSAAVIRTPVDEVVVLGVLRRQITRRPPFHRSGSQSYGDAALVETIINLGRWTGTDAGPGDEIIFVSRNHADFSEPGKPDSLHPDLAEDIAKALPGVTFTFSRHLLATLKQRFGVSVPEEVVADEAQAVDQATSDAVNSAKQRQLAELTLDRLRAAASIPINPEVLDAFNATMDRLRLTSQGVSSSNQLQRAAEALDRLRAAASSPIDPEALEAFSASMDRLRLAFQPLFSSLDGLRLNTDESTSLKEDDEEGSR